MSINVWYCYIQSMHVVEMEKIIVQNSNPQSYFVCVLIKELELNHVMEIQGVEQRKLIHNFWKASLRSNQHQYLRT